MHGTIISSIEHFDWTIAETFVIGSRSDAKNVAVVCWKMRKESILLWFMAEANCPIQTGKSQSFIH
jgi:hypothetical protein